MCIVSRRRHVPEDHGRASEEPEAGDEEWEILRRAHPGVHHPFRGRTPGDTTNVLRRK